MTAITLNLEVPGCSGRLGGRLYLPEETPCPTVFIMTPYSVDRYHEVARWFADRGFAVLVCDVAGRGDSDGVFEPSGAGVGADGAAAIEWIRGQEWSDGGVVTWGGSFLGFAQWTIAKEHPVGLAAMAPSAAWKPGYDAPRLLGIYRTWDVNWHAFVSGRSAQNNLYEDKDWWRSLFLDAYRSLSSVAELADRLDPRTLGATARANLARPAMDGEWDALDPSPDDYARLDLPILSITGYYDDDQWGALQRYFAHMAHGTPEGRAKHYLLIGPWDHTTSTRGEARDIGGYRFGEASVPPRRQLLLDWYLHALGRGPAPAFLEKRVGYYVTGEEAWRWADSYEDVSDRTLELFLASDGTADSTDRPGALQEEPSGQAADTFVADPFDLRPGEQQDFEPEDFVVNPQPAQLWGDGAVYESAPFAAPVVVAGMPELDLHLECDTPDADLQFFLFEVGADGASFLLTQTVMRLRWRHSLYEQTLWTEGATETVRVEHFLFFARRFEAGTRLRLVVRALSSLSFERNLNTGGAVGFEDPDSARRATLTIHHGTTCPSVLRLPVARD
jgi:putative CocE/NonD family hydrolase